MDTIPKSTVRPVKNAKRLQSHIPKYAIRPASTKSKASMADAGRPVPINSVEKTMAPRAITHSDGRTSLVKFCVYKFR